MSKTKFISSIVKSYIFWLLIGSVVLVFSGPAFLTAICLYPYDQTRKAIHFVISGWAKTTVLVCPLMKVSIEGQEWLDPKKTYVLVSNHQSVADIIVSLHLKQSFKFIAKQELFWIPFLGWSMWLAGYIPLIRGNQQSGKKALMIAKSFVEHGTSVLFFPEGTRSPDGEIHAFKFGAFKLAAETGVPVVPIVINGTYNLVPKGSRIFNRRVKVRLKVLEPRKAPGNDNVSIERFSAEIRSDMIGALNAQRIKKEIELTSIS